MTEQGLGDIRRTIVQVQLDLGLIVKIVVDSDCLGEDHGIPGDIIANFPEGVPLELNPEWPLNIVYNDDALHADLAFGSVHRCVIPWTSIQAVITQFGTEPTHPRKKASRGWVPTVVN